MKGGTLSSAVCSRPMGMSRRAVLFQPGHPQPLRVAKFHLSRGGHPSHGDPVRPNLVFRIVLCNVLGESQQGSFRAGIGGTVSLSPP